MCSTFSSRGHDRLMFRVRTCWWVLLTYGSREPSVPRSYVRLIITADRVVIPQDGFEQRPQFHDFVARLLTGIAEAAAARQRREDSATNAGGGNGGAAGGQPPLSPGDDYEGDQQCLIYQRSGGRRPSAAMWAASLVMVNRHHFLPPSSAHTLFEQRTGSTLVTQHRAQLQPL